MKHVFNEGGATPCFSAGSSLQLFENLLIAQREGVPREHGSTTNVINSPGKRSHTKMGGAVGCRKMETWSTRKLVPFASYYQNR